MLILLAVELPKSIKCNKYVAQAQRTNTTLCSSMVEQSGSFVAYGYFHARVPSDQPYFRCEWGGGALESI